MIIFDQDLDQESQRDRNRFWLTVGLAAGLAGVVAALLLLLVRANENYQESLRNQTSSLEVINSTRAMDGAISRAEAALGRFVVGLINEDGLIFDEQWRRARAYLTQLEREVKDNPEQAKNVALLRAELERRQKFLFDVALNANYNRALAAISKYHAAGQDEGLLRIDRLINTIISTERRELLRRSRDTEADRESLNSAMWLFSCIGAVTAIFAISTTFSLIRATGERRLAELEQYAESERASELEAAVASRTAELAQANAAIRKEMIERENAEAKLRQAQKMEAVGQLTGGIAHDFNNMLAVVVGGLELATRSLRKDAEKTERHLENALDGANRAADLTRRLLTFARNDPARPEATEVDSCINAFVPLIERTIGDRIDLELDLQASGAFAMIDRHQFENALLNLAVNGRDAMDGSGRLIIRSFVDQGAAVPTIAVQVIDAGCGMDDDVLQRIFDPFFTTKPSGQGTGLGMSQVFGFARQSQGEVKVRSTVGQGTNVSIMLPMLSDAPEQGAVPANLSATPAPMLRPHNLQILVVEDDERVLAATVAGLHELGHRATACNNPLLAIELLREHPPHDGGFDMVLTDVLMPNLTGPELAKQIQEIWPTLPIIFVTGYAGEASELETAIRDDVLRKPYSLAALDQKIRRHIERSAVQMGTQMGSI